MGKSRWVLMSLLLPVVFLPAFYRLQLRRSGVDSGMTCASGDIKADLRSNDGG